MTTATAKRPRVMSGMRPTGNLHLGHYVGVLTQWVKYCDTADAFFEIADLHALTTSFEDPQAIRDARNSMVVDWLAAGVDPKKSTFYLQSGVPEISELEVLLGMITPISWLERVPTYKGQIAEIGPEIATYGFLGYPLLQLCDIAVFRGELVPVGKDQVAHLEFAREVVRRFNYLYGGDEQVLVEPKAMLSNFPDVPGTDGRKMSKSYNNVILLSDDEAATTEKVRGMLTDPQKVRRNDPGRPRYVRFSRYGSSSSRSTRRSWNATAAPARWAAFKTKAILPKRSTNSCGHCANGACCLPLIRPMWKRSSRKAPRAPEKSPRRRSVTSSAP